MNLRKLALLFAALGAPLLVQAADPAQCDRVRFADVGWTDITATTAVARLLFTELGYRTQVKRLSVPDTYKALAQRQIDVFLGNWMPSMEGDIRPYLDNGSVQTLGANLEGAKYTLAVPREAYEGGLKSFADIARFKEQLGGRIHGIEPGNDGNQLIKKMIDDNAFGLGGFTLVESSESRMLAEVRRAAHLKQWRVFLGWEPHPMNTMVEMRYLSGGDQYFGPDYGGATVYTNIRAGYAEQCPNAARLLSNLRFSLDMENRLMEAILDPNTNRRRVARAWLQVNPGTVAQWLQGVTRRDGSPVQSLLATSTNP
jgi:glycine betaine/proline transport system substrate-binding protein